MGALVAAWTESLQVIDFFVAVWLHPGRALVMDMQGCARDATRLTPEPRPLEHVAPDNVGRLEDLLDPLAGEASERGNIAVRGALQPKGHHVGTFHTQHLTIWHWRVSIMTRHLLT